MLARTEALKGLWDPPWGINAVFAVSSSNGGRRDPAAGMSCTGVLRVACVHVTAEVRVWALYFVGVQAPVCVSLLRAGGAWGARAQGCLGCR